MFEERMADMEALARQQGLDFFPTTFEVVPQDIMTEIAAYGLPTRARHWSYGKVYQSQRLYGTMGLSKTLGKEDFEGLGHQLRAYTSKECFGLLIDHPESSSRIDHQQSIGRHVQELLQARGRDSHRCGRGMELSFVG